MVRKKASSTEDTATAATKHEQPLQAVLLADSFVNTFRPLSLDRPKMLCPLNNVTLIDYAVDFLAGAGVEELIVVCVSDKVETHVMQHTSLPIQVSVIKDSSLANAGDALRELDKRDLVQSDPFILMYGDVLTNVDVSGVIAAHKERHKKDRSAIMTILLKPVGVSDICGSSTKYSSIRTTTEDLVVGIDPTQDNRILVYDDKSSRASVSVPCSFFALHPQVDLRCDLLDCGIDICSPDVLARFTDEFDYSEIRRMFVANSVAEEEEGLQNKIYAHLLAPSEYAARVHDFSTYHAISRDLLRRWCYPVVPDNLPSGYEKQYRYVLQRHCMYYEHRNGKAKVGRSSQVQGAGMIGTCCCIGEDCQINCTVIGNHCHIAANVNIQGSHLWDNVVVEEGAVIVQSILADGCLVKVGAVVQRGCIIGAGCVIGAGIVLPEYTRLSLKVESDDNFDDDWGDDSSSEASEGSNVKKEVLESEAMYHKNVVGPDGKGIVWNYPLDDDEEETENLPPAEILRAQSIGFNPTALFAERQKIQREREDCFSDEESTGNINDLGEYDGGITFVSDDTNAQAASIVGRQKGVDVIKELKSICLEYEPASPIENLAIELNSFKFSQNATYVDCTTAATLAILEQMSITKDTTDGKLVQEFKSYLDHWAPLLQKMSIGLDEEKGIVLALEQCALESNERGQTLSSGTSFRFLLQTLHDEEIVSDEAILSWAADRQEDADGSRLKKLLDLPLVKDFLEWLEQESEDEDGSSEED